MLQNRMLHGTAVQVSDVVLGPLVFYFKIIIISEEIQAKIFIQNIGQKILEPASLNLFCQCKYFGPPPLLPHPTVNSH